MNIYQKYGMSLYIQHSPEVLYVADFTDYNVGYFLGNCMFDINDSSIVSVILEDVEKVLSGQIPFSHGQTPHTHYILIEPVLTSIYQIDYGAPAIPAGSEPIPDYTLPTVDFRDILIEWKKFLDNPVDRYPGPLPV